MLIEGVRGRHSNFCSKSARECEFAKIPHFPGQPSVYWVTSVQYIPKSLICGCLLTQSEDKCESQATAMMGETCSTGEVARQELGGKQGSEKTGHAKTEAAISVTTDRGLGGQHGRSAVPRNQDLGALRKLPI